MSERSSSETRIPVDVGAQRGAVGRVQPEQSAGLRSVYRPAEPVEGNELGEGSAPSAETNNFCRRVHTGRERPRARVLRRCPRSAVSRAKPRANLTYIFASSAESMG